MTTVDWNKLQEAAQNKLLADGVYDLRVKGVKVAKAKKTDPTTGEPKNMLKVRFEVVSGPAAGYSDLYTNLTISPESSGAMIIFFRQLAILGADANFMASNPTLEQVGERITGAYCTADVGHREWAGAPRNEVNEIRPYAGPAQAQTMTIGPGDVAAVPPAVLAPQPPVVTAPAPVAPQVVPAPQPVQAPPF